MRRGAGALGPWSPGALHELAAPSFWSSDPSRTADEPWIVNRGRNAPAQAPAPAPASSGIKTHLDPSKFETHLQFPHLAYPSLAAQRPTHVTSTHLTNAVDHVIALLIPPAQVSEFQTDRGTGKKKKRRMVKPLTFKGDKKPKKRKREHREDGAAEADDSGKQVAASSSSSSNKVARTDDDNAENDDSWVSADVVSDISGPVMFVLPSEPLTALACDANGKVFTLPIENVVDGNAATAEPHDVRMVWVANKIAGTENHRFKGSHGKFLGCDKYGILSAVSEAVSPLESFVLVPTADTPGTFQVQTLRETYLTVQASTSSRANAPPEVRGDATDMTFDTTLRIRMQARFKPRFKASKEEKAREKISRAELEEAAGRRLDEAEVKMLKRARREGDYHERLLDLKTKNKHDKYG